MLIKIAHPHPIKSSEITPEEIYRDRRRFLAKMGITAVALAVAGCGSSDRWTCRSKISAKD
jgi:sulfoxide reductase catalytic subunit YedY